MLKKQAVLLWEDVLKHGNGNSVIKKFSLDKKEAKIFLEHTKPEMFVSEELSRKSLIEVRKLEQKVNQISTIIKKKKSSSLMLNIMFGVYFFTILPILALIIRIKYFSPD